MNNQVTDAALGAYQSALSTSAHNQAAISLDRDLDGRSPITEQWLRETGFRYDEPFRKGERNWTLWLGGAASDRQSREDLGVELMQHTDPADIWSCWVRADYACRYCRFIHVRDMHETSEVIRLIEGLSGQTFNPFSPLAGEPSVKVRLILPSARFRPSWRQHGAVVDVLAVERQTGADPDKRELLRP